MKTPHPLDFKCPDSHTLWLTDSLRLQALVGCSKGGQKDIFTPMYLCVCRKPGGAR